LTNILQPGEKVLYSTNAHWTYVPAIVTWVAAQRRWLNAAREVALVSHLLLDRQSPNSDHDQTPRLLMPE